MRRNISLAKNSEFQRVRQRGKSWAHPLVVLVVLPNRLPHARVGFSVSKQLGGAVTRNRIKRMLREVVRLQSTPLKPGFDLVLIGRQGIVGQDYHKIAEAVGQLLQRARLYEIPVQPPPAPLVERAKGVEGEVKE